MIGSHYNLKSPWRCLIRASAIAGLVLVARTAIGQTSVQNDTLLKPVARLDRGFSTIGAVRVLSDGNVLVIDADELNVYMVAADLRNARPIGRKGDGPNEYGRPYRLLALRGDTTAIVEAIGNRMLLVSPNGQPLRIVDPGGLTASDPPQKIRVMGAQATDTQGRFYTEGVAQEIGRTGFPVRSDSAPVERWSSSGAKRDTMVMLYRGALTSGVTPTGVSFRRLELRPFETQQQWAVSHDGHVAIINPEPYSVRLVEPNGLIVEGPRLSYDRIRVTEQMKRDFMTEAEYEYNQPGDAVRITKAGGAASASKIPLPPLAPPEKWPTFLPPFLLDAVRFDMNGRLWVERAGQPGALRAYDVFDARARLRQRVFIPRESRVVAFGADGVYVARTNTVGEEFLEKYSYRP